MSHTLRDAGPADFEAVTSLLTACALPLDGVPASLQHFVVAVDDGAVVGVAGIEDCGDYGLLRSAAVHETWRGRGLGRALVERVLDRARARRYRALYLLTTTASDYFPAFGFVTATRDEVPASVRATSEFTSACPASAAVMKLDL